jgi:hypothetical protein
MPRKTWDDPVAANDPKGGTAGHRRQLTQTQTLGLWPDKREGPWHVKVRWTSIAGRDECVGLDLTFGGSPTTNLAGGEMIELVGDGPVALTASEFRTFQFGRAIAAARQAQTRKTRDSDDDRGTVARKPHDETWFRHEVELRLPPKLPDGLPRNAKRYGSDHWNAVAIVYLLAREAGLPPTRAVAEHFDKPYATARSWVQRIRESGLIPPTSRGVASG